MFHSGFYLFGYLKQWRSMKQRNLQVNIFGLCFFHLYFQCLRIGYFCAGHFHRIRNTSDLCQIRAVDLKAIGCLIPGNVLLLDRNPLWKFQLHGKTLLFYCQRRGSFLLHRIDLELEAICPLLIRLFHGCHRQVIFRHFPNDMKNPGFNTDSHPPIYLHIRSGVITAITGCRCRWRCCRWRCYRWRRRRWCCYGWCLYG